MIAVGLCKLQVTGKSCCNRLDTEQCVTPALSSECACQVSRPFCWLAYEIPKQEYRISASMFLSLIKVWASGIFGFMAPQNRVRHLGLQTDDKAARAADRAWPHQVHMKPFNI